MSLYRHARLTHCGFFADTGATEGRRTRKTTRTESRTRETNKPHLDELDRSQSLRRKLDGLIEASLPTIRNVHHLDDVLQEAGVEQVASLRAQE